MRCGLPSRRGQCFPFAFPASLPSPSLNFLLFLSLLLCFSFPLLFLLSLPPFSSLPSLLFSASPFPFSSLLFLTPFFRHSELDALRSDSRTTLPEPFCQKNSVGLLRYPKKSIFLQGIDWRSQITTKTQASISKRGPNTEQPIKKGKGDRNSRVKGRWRMDQKKHKN